MSALVDLAAVQADDALLSLLGSDQRGRSATDVGLARVLLAWRLDVVADLFPAPIPPRRSVLRPGPRCGPWLSPRRKPMSDRAMTDGLSVDDAQERVLVAATGVLQAQQAEPHAYSAAESEYAGEQLALAARDLVEAMELSDVKPVGWWRADEQGPQVKDDRRHLDSWADSHEGYTVQTRVAVVKCLWCDYIAIDATRREAVARYQREHEQPILDRELAHRRAPADELDPQGGAR